MCELVPKIPADHKKEIYLNENEKKTANCEHNFPAIDPDERSKAICVAL